MTPLDLYRDMRASGRLSPDAGQESAARSLQRVYDELTAPPAGLIARLRGTARPVRGLYLYGPVGRGKTALMDMFFMAVPAAIPKKRVHFHDFMIGVHEFLHAARMAGRSGEGADSALLSYARKIADETRLLCFDEFHVTDVADAMILGRLFTALFDRGLAVVATSNWEPQRLYEGGLQRDRFMPFIALVQERMEVVRLDGGEDYRLRALRDAGVYFSPLGPHAAQQAEALIERLTDGASFGEDRISVKGHSYSVKAAKAVARVSFAALCERPLGAADYIELAQRYPTVFLEGVPKLTYDRRNEAKRLMTLIDVLYEHGTRLIVTADAPPENLYRGDDHAFEFQRTVSRLIEMQGAEYLARAQVSAA